MKFRIDPEIKPTLWIYPQLIKLVFTFIFVTDPSLSIVERLGIVPYGVLWNWMNLPSYLLPYSYGTPLTYAGFNLLEFQYKAYLWILDVPVTYLAFKKISGKMFWFSQIWSCWVFMGFFQNVTIYWFLILGAWDPGFTVLAVLAKLPFGWGNPLDLANPHVQCALHCGGPGDGLTEILTRRSLLKVISYGSLMIWTVAGPLYWALRRRSKNLKAHNGQL